MWGSCDSLVLLDPNLTNSIVKSCRSLAGSASGLWFCPIRTGLTVRTQSEPSPTLMPVSTKLTLAWMANRTATRPSADQPWNGTRTNDLRPGRTGEQNHRYRQTDGRTDTHPPVLLGEEIGSVVQPFLLRRHKHTEPSVTDTGTSSEHTTERHEAPEPNFFQINKIKRARKRGGETHHHGCEPLGTGSGAGCQIP